MPYAVELHDRTLSVVDLSTGHARAPKKSNRGTIRGISSKSRYRLIKLLSKISRPDEAVFVTLTYRSFTDDFQVWKSHLHNFRRRLSADFPDYSAVWRMEFQKRGAPHFHILAWLAQSITLEALETRLSEVWLRCIGQQSAANQEYGVTVEPVTDFRRSAFYLSVYQAKDAQDRDDIQTGREWGTWKRERLGLEPLSRVVLDDGEFRLFRRIVRRSARAFLRCRYRDTGKGKTTSNYLRALRREQPFTNFMPFHESRRLVDWITSQPPF